MLNASVSARVRVACCVVGRAPRRLGQDGDGTGGRVKNLLTCGEVDHGRPGVEDPGRGVHEEGAAAVLESRVDAPESAGGGCLR